MKKKYVVPRYRVLPLRGTELIAASSFVPEAVPPATVNLEDEVDATEIG